MVGEEVVATCTRVAGGYAEAELVRVKRKSKHRVQPACESVWSIVVDVNTTHVLSGATSY